MLRDFTVVKKGVLIQCVVLLLLFVFYWGYLGRGAGISALLGGLICIIPQVVFMKIYFKDFNERSVGVSVNLKHVLRRFYWGEAVKLLIAILLFTVSFQWGKLEALPLFVSFMASQLVYWAVTLILK